MKIPKATPQNAVPEECGVWLDTVQLKGKTQQKRPARPISKLLNPFVEGSGYSLAVALNFTQTKMEMPKTKQSSISTFFTSHRRVLNKMSSSEVPNLCPLQTLSSSTASTATSLASARKRGRDISPKKSDLYYADSGVSNWSSEINVTETEATSWQKRAEHHSPFNNLYSESKEDQPDDCKPPQSKRRLTEKSLLTNNKQLRSQAWNQDCSQYSEREFYLPDQKSTTLKNSSTHEPCFLGSLQSEETFGHLIDVKNSTSTQKLIEASPSSQKDDDKENCRFHASPKKNRSQLWSKARKEECFDAKWTKPKKPPQQIMDVDEESLATLFTQDTEGFRVIAHRGLQTRNPLKDQSNLNTDLSRPDDYMCVLEEEDEDEMLFTQDSQGNMVIKH